MTFEFEASNGFTIREQGKGVVVDNLYIGEQHLAALREYFQGVAVA